MRNNYHNPQQTQQSITKISRSKSRNQMAIVTKLKEKESKWNQRFHLEQIPQYNYLNEPHSQYLKNKFRIPNRKNDPSKAKRIHQPSLDKNKVHNKPNPRKNEERLKQAINKAFSDLKSLWYEKNIPQCHMQLMTKIFNRQNNPMKILQDIKQQFSDITKQISLIQKIVLSIETRQNCMVKIQEIIANIGQNDNVRKSVKIFQEKISHLRILTIHCIQCIYQWKQSIEPLLPKPIKALFWHLGSPYTKKIKLDYKEIIQSPFKQLYSFDIKKIDAFFLNYTLEGKKISNVSKNLLKRIRLCEIMLSQDQQAPNNQQQETNVRSPLIQKLRSPPLHHRQDRSMPPRGKTPVITPWKKISIQYGQFPEYFINSLKKSAFGKSFQPIVQMGKYQEITIFQYMETNDEIILAVDKNASQRKIILLALKSSVDTVQATLKSLCEYLWQHDYCTQIRTSLVHQQIGDIFSVDNDLQKKFKTVGFRWVSVNHNNDLRMTIYGIKRPLNTAAHKTAKRTQAYPVIIEHLTILNLLQNKQKKSVNNCLAGILSLFKFIQEQKKQQYEQICKRDQFAHYLDCLVKIQDYLKKQAIREGLAQGYETTFTYSGLRAFQITNEQKQQKVFANVEVSPKQIASYPSYISLLNTSFKFNHITLNDGKYTKFFPSKDNQILICESNYPIYLLQTDQQNINFFIIEVQDNFSMQSIDSIFHAMGQQSSYIDEFWLPTFKKSLSYIDEVALTNRQLISTDYRNCLSSLTRKSKVRTKIIRPPFVFGMINKKLLELLQVPFYCTLVGKNDIL